MSRTIRASRIYNGRERVLRDLPEGLHRKKHYRCRCEYCLNVIRERNKDSWAKKEIKDHE